MTPGQLSQAVASGRGAGEGPAAAPAAGDVVQTPEDASR